MSRSQKFAGCLLVILSAAVCSSCSPLEKWVRERGFKYDKNYSTINKLGYKVVNGVPKPEWSWRFESRQGKTADFDKEENRTIEIKSSGELSKLMKHITDANFSADLNSVGKSIITLKNPFTEEAVKLVPIYTVAGSGTQRIKIVDRVLNCGEMRIKVYDKNNMNISAKINLKGTVDVKGSLHYEGDSNSIISGENYYVGYDFSEKKLRRGEIHSFEITSESSYNKELGVLAQLHDVNENPNAPHVHEGLVCLAIYPIGTELSNTKSLQIAMRQIETAGKGHKRGLSTATVDEGYKAPSTTDLWKTTTKVEKNTGEVFVFKSAYAEEPKLYRVKMGSQLTITPSDGVSITLVITGIKQIREGEGKDVTNYSVFVDGQTNILK